jgi:2-C-methyl-D-erythritol 2,4-cyclodiphosphate synthase
MGNYRVGQGWDNHRLVEGRPLILAGVKIDSNVGLDGHSDADVLCHAIVDAILGASSLGDIGVHFPDSDAKWKDVPSLKFVSCVEKMACDAGFKLMNVDATVILQQPKLGDYRQQMREKLAEALRLNIGSVSVKFKTSEKVGPVGEGRSAEAQAIVLLASKY